MSINFNLIKKSILTGCDSYKVSHYMMQNPNNINSNQYIESRGGLYSNVLFFGMQGILKEVLSETITHEKIDSAKELYKLHFGVELFNEEGWRVIVDKFDGKLPIIVETVDEGTVLPVKNVLVQYRLTDDAEKTRKLAWLPGWLETTFMRVWYPTTVATYSYNIRKIIKKYVAETSDGDPLVDFRLHDFGSRGGSSYETAGIGGAAHLATGALGSDTIDGIVYAHTQYGLPEGEIAGYSVAASEHSVTCSWGKEGELDFYKHLVNTITPGTILSVVSDTYDIDGALDYFCDVLKDDILAKDIKLVVRPDSGVPVGMVMKCLTRLGEGYGFTVNNKGYKVLNHVRVIQGDGIDMETVSQILSVMKTNGWSAENIVFGSGGALIQDHQRDNISCALKASCVKVEMYNQIPKGISDEDIWTEKDKIGHWYGVSKQPKTDMGKQSKKNILALVIRDGEYQTIAIQELKSGEDNLLKVRYDGKDFVNQDSFNTIRSRVKY